MAENEVDLDSIIDRLLEVRGSRPGKQVQLLETEIRYLCTKAREIFISQPILLELEAPIKVSATPSCARTSTRRANILFRFAVIYMGSTTIFCACSSTAASHRKQTTSSSVTMSTVASSPWKPFACFSHTRSSTLRISSFSAATTNAQASTASTVSTTSANEDTTSSYGRRSPIASTACPLPLSSTRRSSPCTAV
jgi:hypothetical protein